MSVTETYLTNIITLYKMTIELMSTPERRNRDEWGKDAKDFIKRAQTDKELDALYDELVMYWDALLEEFPQFHIEPRLMRTMQSDDQEVDGETMSNNLLFRPIGQELLAKLVRGQLDIKLADPSKFTSAELKDALSGLGEAEWRLFAAPWRNFMFVYQEDRWKMRNEDRGKVKKEGLRLMRWIVGLDVYGDEAELIAQIKEPWKQLLLNVSDEEAEELWENIADEAARFRG